MTKFSFFFCLLAVLAVAGCRTGGQTVVNESQIASSSASGITLKEGFDASLPLPKDEGQNLYLKMLSVELASGAKVPKDQLHSILGVFQCQQQGSLTPCSYRVRLKGDLSPSQLFDRFWTDKLFAFAQAVRPDLGDERLIMGDLVCDYIGKKSPPYDMEDVKCSVRYPRKPTETIFVDKQAEELSELLRGDAPIGNDIVKLSGAVNCRYVDSSKRAICVVRAVSGGLLQETLKEVAAASATSIANKLRVGYADFRTLSGAAAQDAMPREMTATLICSVDSRKLDNTSRNFVCSAGF